MCEDMWNFIQDCTISQYANVLSSSLKICIKLDGKRYEYTNFNVTFYLNLRCM